MRANVERKRRNSFVEKSFGNATLFRPAVFSASIGNRDKRKVVKSVRERSSLEAERRDRKIASIVGRLLPEMHKTGKRHFFLGGEKE